jgi:hypothetical protein
MSLDFYLITEDKKKKEDSSGIFIREGGMTKEISAEEWNERYPDREPITLACYEEETNEVFHSNITHNLGQMARMAGVYNCLWRPNESEFYKAAEIIVHLEDGIKFMEDDPKFYKQFDSENGWGTYEQFLHWVKDVLQACKENLNANIEVSV